MSNPDPRSEMKDKNSDRRQNSERRNATARRRFAETRRVYIELCHSVLRVAIVVDTEGSELPSIRTRTVRWRNEADNLHGDQGRTELAASLRLLVNEERLAGCQVALAISSTLCVNRASTGATARVEQEITDLRERSQLYLSLGPGPKTAAIARKNIDARHEHALVTVTNEQTLDLLVNAAESAGLTVEVVESALVALSRLHGHLDPEQTSAVILAQLDEDRFEIGVSRNGQLLLEYRPSSDAKVGDLGKIVDQHHDRLKRFCQRQYGVGVADLEQMWLVGETAEVEATNAATQTAIETAVLPLDTISELWRIEKSTISAEMGAALGLALRDRSEGSGICPNLMDEIHAQAKTPLRPFLLRAAAPIAASLLVAAGLWAVNLEQKAELSALRQQVERAKPTHLRGLRLSKQLADTAVEIQHLSHLESNTPEQRITPLVQGVGFCLPDDVWLKQLRIGEQGEVAVSGTSYTEGSVYDFVRHLEEAPPFDDVALRGTGQEQTPQGPATSFDIDFTLAPAMPAAK